MQSYNSTLLSQIPFRVPTTHDYEPFYIVYRQRMIPALSDLALTLIIPIVAYWGYAAVFHLLDYLRLPFIEQYRLHEPEEIAKRNKVTIGEVVKAVILQHAVQTLLGAVALESERPAMGPAGHNAALTVYASRLAHYTLNLFGPKLGGRLLMQYGSPATLAIYWWLFPAAQIFFSFFALDTWQYFCHRAFHVNKWLYRHIHARHHRLYVPYACGALYNHPFEGFIMDTVGTYAAHLVAGLSPRQDMILFGVSMLKTVDDHSGLAIPWDPFQIICGNNADYHDIHHQQFGIKRNFAQPWFIHWDVLLGTRMTRDQARKRPKTATDLRDPNVKEGIGSTDVLINRKDD